MIVFIAGTSHTGKTVLAQNMLEKYKIPYLSIDHLKMGLIRSGETRLTPEDDEELTPYLWNIVKEIAKTAIENKQNLIIEGDYIPFDWKKDFGQEYSNQILYRCLIMSKHYINTNFENILKHANVIEKRLDNTYCTKKYLLLENSRNLFMCNKHDLQYILIEDVYKVDIVLP